jgi:hypothetical protein
MPGKFLILILTFLYPTPSLGQEIRSSVNSHIIGFNIGSNQVKENLLIPKAHTGSVISVSYGFEKEGRNFHEFTFNIGYGRLKTKLETDKVTWNGQINTGYSWGKSLISREKVKYYLGADLKYHLTLMEYPVWDESRAYWGTALTAGLFTRVRMVFNNKSSWVSSLCIDLLGFSSRPDEVRIYAQEEWTLANILKITNTGYSFTLIDNTFMCSIQNEYRIFLKNDNFLSFCNSITYASISEYQGKSLLSVRINFGIGLGF